MVKKFELPRFGKLPNIKYVQIQTHSRCNADCVFPLTGETLVFTPQGYVEIGKLVGKCTLLVPSKEDPRKGVFKEAEVRSYGIQPILNVAFGLKKAFSRQTKYVRCSTEHRWILSDKSEKKTSKLLPNDKMLTMNLAESLIEGVDWTVEHISDMGESEEVFCAHVPDEGCFVLQGGLVTGNCPYIESEHAANHGVMDDELWKHVLLNLKPFADGINHGKVCPYLMQEPLIDKTIFSKINDIYKFFPSTSVEISTNGAALTDKVIDKLLACFKGKKHDLWVSHHGINAETLQYIMKIDYEKAHSNLINLLKKANGKFNIRIRGAGQSRDGKHVFFTREQYLAYWDKNIAEHGIDRTRLDIDAFTFHDRAGTLHRVDRDACKMNIGKIRDIGKGHAPFYCPRIDQWIHIMYDGTIRLCCMDYHGEVKLPNLKDIWLPDYFQSEEYTTLIKKVTGMIDSPDDFICKRCISPGG